MRKAAHLMVSSLAGSLALVTCREPLRSSLATQLRHLLANTMDAGQLDQTVNVSQALKTNFCRLLLGCIMMGQIILNNVNGIRADGSQKFEDHRKYEFFDPSADNHKR